MEIFGRESAAMVHPELNPDPDDPTGMQDSFDADMCHLARVITPEEEPEENALCAIGIVETDREGIVQKIVMQQTAVEVRQLLSMTVKFTRRVDRKLMRLASMGGTKKVVDAWNHVLIYRMTLELMRDIYREAFRRAMIMEESY